MWPGVRTLTHAKGFDEFAQDDVVVVYAWNSKVRASGGQEERAEEQDDSEE